jgi:hypothetical protein
MINPPRGGGKLLRGARYLPEPSKVVYWAKDGTEEKVFDAPVTGFPQEGEELLFYLPPAPVHNSVIGILAGRASVPFVAPIS